MYYVASDQPSPDRKIVSRIAGGYNQKSLSVRRDFDMRGIQSPSVAAAAEIRQ
jgi:hypothetical protein